MNVDKHKNKKAIIIGCGIAGPTLAMALQKCGINSTIYESQVSPADNRGGLFLHLGPNGVNILKTLGIDELVRREGHPCKNFVFEKHNGSIITKISTKKDKERYGVDGIIIRRTIIQRIMREQTESRGIKIEWNKKLQNITTDKNGEDVVTAHFEDDSSSVSGDCIIGCDGLHSSTRKIIMPDAPAPKYSGNVVAGAFTPNQTKQPRNELTFHFGKKAYMIYFVTSKGDAMWGAHLNIDENSLHDVKSSSQEQWRQKVSNLYDKDASYIKDFTKKMKTTLQRFPCMTLNPCLSGTKDWFVWSETLLMPRLLMPDKAHQLQWRVHLFLQNACEIYQILGMHLQDTSKCERTELRR